MSAPAFRFDADTHTYRLVRTAEALPHITGMLTASGWVDDEWYTDEGRERGHAVHALTAEHDLGAISSENLRQFESVYRGYLLAYIDALGMVKPEWEWVEEPLVHPFYGYAGRPDRGGTVYGVKSVGEIKSGAPDKSHRIQTALQAMLFSPIIRLPAEMIHRYVFYLKPTGKWKIERHPDRRDFDEAKRIAKLYGAGRL